MARFLPLAFGSRVLFGALAAVALMPGLAALYVSQAFVFVAYLRFRGPPSAVDWAAAALATVLMGFGLWVVLSQQPYT